MRKLVANQQGQAIVEYILTLSVSIAIVVALSSTFRKSIFKLWVGLAKGISAACPGCPPPPNVR